MRTYRNAPPTVREVWLSSAAVAEREYLIYQDERITYGEAHARVNAIAGWLAEQGGVRGDRVAIAMRNYPEWLMIYWACVASGIAAVGMNAWWVAEEMAYAIKDAAPKVVFCDGERLARLFEKPGVAGGARIVATRMESLHAGRDRLERGRRARWGACRSTWPSTRTTTPRSSTPRAPPAFPRARSSPTAAACTI